VYKATPFSLSDAILKHEPSSENKAVDCPELTKIVCSQGPGAHFCARVQGRDLVLGCRHRVRILVWVLEKRVCSHYCPASIVLGHHARAPSVKAALVKGGHRRYTFDADDMGHRSLGESRAFSICQNWLARPVQR